MDFSGAVPLIFNLPKGQTEASWKLSAKAIFHQKRQIHWYQNILQKHHFLVTFYKDMGWILTGFMPDFLAPGELWGLWLWDSLDMLAASGDPRRPGIYHGYSEGFWAACHTTGSVGAMIPKLCDFLLSYGLQGFEPFPFVGSFGLMGRGNPGALGDIAEPGVLELRSCASRLNCALKWCKWSADNFQQIA